jgi:transposase InsO family protein
VAEHECLSSMSAPGNSLQNRPIEFFWSNLKEECVNLIPYRERTPERILNEVLWFCKRYNIKRRQSGLMDLSPFMYRSLALNATI